MALDKDCKDIPYLLGRLVAIFAASADIPTKLITQAQETPNIAIPQMDVLYHKSPRAIRESEVCEILGHFAPPAPFPSRMTLPQQGQFMIGYNHEMADIYKERNRAKVAKAVRLKRVELGMTQAQLAEKADVTKQTIGNIEGGNYSVSVDVLSAVMAVLGIDMTIE